MKLKLENLLNGCTLSELALCYFPDDQPRSALRGLKRWISYRRALYDDLTAAGYLAKGKQRLTPKMVKMIVEHLGEP